MKKACLIVAVTCLSALLTGCGSSSSDNNNGNLTTQDQTLDSYCLNNPTDQQCQSQQPANCQNNNNGYNNNNGSNFNANNYSQNQQRTCYPTNNNGQYQEGQSLFSGGACQCQSGYMPIRGESGMLECLRRETVVVTDWLLTVSFSSGSRRVRRNGNTQRRNWNEHGVDFVLNQGGQTIDQIVPASGNCYSELPVGCSLSDPYNSCASVNQPGMPAICVPTNGGQTAQGICVNQSVPTR